MTANLPEPVREALSRISAWGFHESIAAIETHLAAITQQAEAHARDAGRAREALTTIRDSTFRSSVTLRSIAERTLSAMQEPQP